MEGEEGVAFEKIPARSFLNPASSYPAWTEDFWIVEYDNKTQDSSHWHAQSKLFEVVVDWFKKKVKAVDIKSPPVTICIAYHERLQ